MAYMSQEKKKEIQVKLREVMPEGWVWSLSVRHHQALVLTIWKAPAADVPGIEGYHKVNQYCVNDHYGDRSNLCKTLNDIVAVMNKGNYDNSERMFDYYDVGWYIDIRFGRWDKPFVTC